MKNALKNRNKKIRLELETETPKSNYTTPVKVATTKTKTKNPLLKKVVKGDGKVTSVPGIVTYSKKGSTRKRVLRVLLDSGSDSDLLFLHEDTRDICTIKERGRRQNWQTSNGTFSTRLVTKLDCYFPEYSESKRVQIKPHVLECTGKSKPVYDLILGVQSLANIGCILDFVEMKVTIDKICLPMRPHDSFLDPAKLQAAFQEHLEPKSTLEATKRVVEILDAKYEKQDLSQVIKENCAHLTARQQSQLNKLLTDFEILFDGGLGDWRTTPVALRLKPGATPYKGRPYPIPKIHLRVLKREVERLVELGVLKKQPESEWASPTFIIPKKDKTVRFISDFREVNKRIVRYPYPIPKISSILQEMEGFTYATQLDLNMGYYTIRLDPDAQKICTIILPWGKYSYMRLPMGLLNSPDMFQEKMSTLMEELEYVRAYLDDLLVITNGTYEDHLAKVRKVLVKLQEKHLKVNLKKSHFAQDEVEYLGYILNRHGIKPMPQKVSAILALLPPTNVKQLRKFLGIIQYYRDVWEKRSELLAPLTDLVGECGHTKVTKKNKTKKKPWHWDEIHQQSFDKIKEIVSRDIILAYPDFSSEFEIYTDSSSRQLGAVIVQKNRPLAFFSRKLTETQEKYSVTEQELLAIVECLKEFKGMLWGQKIKVYTDHKNLMRDALGLTSDRVYRWRLLLEEYGPEIIWIKGIHNAVADALSRLDYDPTKNTSEMTPQQVSKLCCMMFRRYEESFDDAEKVCYMARAVIDSDASPGSDTSSDAFTQETIARVFANVADDEDEIYPVTISQIAESQRSDKNLKAYFNPAQSANKSARKKRKKDNYKFKDIDGQKVLVHQDTRLVIPAGLQSKVVQWYHHYLLHPGHTRLEETIAATMYWPSLRSDVRAHTKSCERCQKGKKRKRQKYGHLPPKVAETIPWRTVCVDLIGPYTLKGKDGTIMDFMCLTMIDPASGWFELIELPNKSVTYVREGNEITDVIIDKSSAQISVLFNRQWLSRYPRASKIIYDNGSEFKLHFAELCDTYGIERKPTTIKNPQANAILERVHGVLANMMRASGLDMDDTVSEDTIADFLVNAAWAIRSTHHTVLGCTPGAAVFGRDMMFDIPYLTDWNAIGRRRQQLVDRNNARENARRIEYDYKVGGKCLVYKDGVLRKGEDQFLGPYTITEVHTNGTVRIQRGTISERLNIRRIVPYFERDETRGTA